MSKVKSIGTIIRQLYPMMPVVRSYIKLCKNMLSTGSVPNVSISMLVVVTIF